MYAIHLLRPHFFIAPPSNAWVQKIVALNNSRTVQKIKELSIVIFKNIHDFFADSDVPQTDLNLKPVAFLLAIAFIVILIAIIWRRTQNGGDIVPPQSPQTS